MLSYSIAIRTLGKSGYKFLRELESIKRQSIQPEKVIVYIADGYPHPDFQIGKEEYVRVNKGMVSQRTLRYDEIDSDVILFLDDDVELSDDSVEKMLVALEQHGADALGADVFANHLMTLKEKIRAAVTNLVFPSWNKNWAFRICKNGSFTYLFNPKRSFYWSQSCAGPVWMIKKKVYTQLCMQNEKWLDDLGFPYAEDQLETYKIYKNGFKLGVLFNSGIKNLNATSSSGDYRKSAERIYIRSKAMFSIWWRSIFQSAKGIDRWICFSAYGIKYIWLSCLFSILSIIRLSPSYLLQFLRGNRDGYRLVHTTEFQEIPPYIIFKDVNTAT